MPHRRREDPHAAGAGEVQQGHGRRLQAGHPDRGGRGARDGPRPHRRGLRLPGVVEVRRLRVLQGEPGEVVRRQGRVGEALHAQQHGGRQRRVHRRHLPVPLRGHAHPPGVGPGDGQALHAGGGPRDGRGAGPGPRHVLRLRAHALQADPLHHRQVRGAGLRAGEHLQGGLPEARLRLGHEVRHLADVRRDRWCRRGHHLPPRGHPALEDQQGRRGR
mmetsp:Transcript_82249/g.233204  ORF Transcript_82249/g.233204 Transcript_82249/m.233204 type:complete len:217 (-) Transcript_82249:151-801(-)